MITELELTLEMFTISILRHLPSAALTIPCRIAFFACASFLPIANACVVTVGAMIRERVIATKRTAKSFTIFVFL